MSEPCRHNHDLPFDGVSPAYKRALIIVILINAVMFVVETYAGIRAASQALLADALDFGSDTATYTLSLLVIGAPLATRAKAALFKGGTLAVIAVIILGSTLWQFLGTDIPEPSTMSIVGALALAANLICLLILVRWRDGDSNIRSVWLCSRNDSIGNVAVIIAGLLVAYFSSAWPDLIVAVLLATLFLRSAWAIISQAREELRTGKPVHHDHHGHHHH